MQRNRIEFKQSIVFCIISDIWAATVLFISVIHFFSHSSSEVSLVLLDQRRRTSELTKRVSNSEHFSSSSQEIPMNFIDPKELDIPNHGTKNRYKTILPSEYCVCVLLRNSSKAALISCWTRKLFYDVGGAKGQRPAAPRTANMAPPSFLNTHTHTLWNNEYSLFSHCQSSTRPD